MPVTQPPYKTLIVTEDHGVCRVQINRPAQLNALNQDVLSELADIVMSLNPTETRALVIEGSKPKAFVAGADIAAMQELTPGEARDFARHGQMVTKALETSPFVTIAKVQGFALGGGCELAMACDLIIAGESARFGQPEVNLGLTAAFGGTQRLVRRVGLPVALDLLLCGKARTLSGQEAWQLGLVSRVVPDDKLEEEVQKVLRGILSAGPSAVAETKRLTRDAYNMSLDAGLSAEAHAFAACFAGDEAQEGIGAFLEKRSPGFGV